MKKLVMASMAVCLFAMPLAVSAQSYDANVLRIEKNYIAEQPVMVAIQELQTQWARIKYQVPDREQKLEEVHKLEAAAAKVTAQYADHAEPKIWEAIILSTDAGIVKGLSALGKVKKAKKLLEAALEQDEAALAGSAHTTLGSLYYQVPGWPIGFGSDKKAEKHLKIALKMNPMGIDSNFFYADFLMVEKRFDEAKTYFNRALSAPDREGRVLADAGRRQEIKAKLAEIDEGL